MITKAQAGALQQSYIASLPERIENIIKAAASAGLTSVVVSWSPASQAQATAFKAVLESNGWTVAQDNVAFTYTIS